MDGLPQKSADWVQKGAQIYKSPENPKSKFSSSKRIKFKELDKVAGNISNVYSIAVKNAEIYNSKKEAKKALGMFGSIKFKPLKIADESETTSWVIVNRASLAKRFKGATSSGDIKKKLKDLATPSKKKLAPSSTIDRGTQEAFDKLILSPFAACYETIPGGVDNRPFGLIFNPMDPNAVPEDGLKGQYVQILSRLGMWGSKPELPSDEFVADKRDEFVQKLQDLTGGESSNVKDNTDLEEYIRKVHSELRAHDKGSSDYDWTKDGKWWELKT